MTKVADIISLGYLGIRDETPLQLLDARTSIYGVRIKDIKKDGTYDLGDRGDVQGAVWYSPEPSKRRIGSWSFAMPAVWESGDTRPIGDIGFEADERYKAEETTSYNLREYPKGFPGIVIASSNQESEEKLFFPSGFDLVAHHTGKAPPLYSSLVYDIAKDGKIDDDSGAGLHSHLWPKKLAGNLNALAWNLTKSRGDSTGWGLYVANTPQIGSTAPKDEERHQMAYASYEMSGPFHPGFKGDKHKIFESLSGSVASGHLSFNTYFVMDEVRDAPLEFWGGDDPNCQSFGFPHRVFLQYDKDSLHGHVTGMKDGLWRWHVKLPFQFLPPPDGSTPGIDEPPYPPWPPYVPLPPIKPLPPIDGGGRGKPKRGGRPTPQPKRLIQYPDPDKVFDEISTSKSQIDEYLKDLRDLEALGITLFPDKKELDRIAKKWKNNPEFWRKFALDSDTRARGILYSTQKSMSPGFAIQAQPSRTLDRLEKYNSNPQEDFVNKAQKEFPAVAQFEGYGHEETPGVFRKTADGRKRYQTGTGDGGILISPPEVGMEDYASGYAPPGVDVSDTYITLLNDRVALAWGHPDPTLGKPVSGYKFTNEAGYLSSRHFDATATADQTGYMDFWHNVSIRGSTGPGLDMVNTSSDPNTDSGGIYFNANADGSPSQMVIRNENIGGSATLSLSDVNGTRLGYWEALTGDLHLDGGSSNKIFTDLFRHTTGAAANTVFLGDASGDATWGKLDIDRLDTSLRSIIGFHHGTFLESFNLLISSDGATITASLEQSGGGDLTMVFNDGFSTLDCTPAATVTVTAGSATVPTANYVYVPYSTKTLTASTSDWPSAEHIKVAYVLLQDAVTVQTKDALVNQNWNDHTQSTSGTGINQGHLTHLTEHLRLTAGGAAWHSGVAPTLTITPVGGGLDNVDIAFSAGINFQAHRHSFPAFDTAAGDDVHIVNDSATPYRTTTDLSSELTDSAGGSMSSKYFTLVFWGVANKTGEQSHIMCNLPSGSYNTQAEAEADALGYTNFTIPEAYKIESSTGFLICAHTLRHQVAGGGTWTEIAVQDLRGTKGGTVAGGGGGGSLVEFSDNQFKIYDDGDNTKIATFQASGITTSTTRTYTFPDADGTLALTSAIPTTGGWRVTGAYTELADTAHQVGIGTTGAPGAKLAIIGDTDEPTFYVLPDTAQANDIVQIYDNAAGKALFVDAAGTTHLGDQATVGATTRLSISNDNDSYVIQGAHGTGYSPFYLFQMSRGTLASPTVVVANDILGKIKTSAYNGSAYTVNSGIEMGVESVAGGGAPYTINTDLRFIAGAGNERMRIKADGTVDHYTHGLTNVSDIDGGSGNLNLTAAASGEVTINDAQEDIDFRIESDTLSHAFFLRGSDGKGMMGDSTDLSPTTTRLQLSNQSSDTDLTIISASATAGDTAGILLQKSRGTLASPTVVNTADVIGGIYGKAWNGTGWATVSGMEMDIASVTGAGAPYTVASNIKFYSGENTLRLLIDEDGFFDFNRNGQTNVASIDGGTGNLNITANAGGEVVINDASEDVDFRVESDNSTTALSVTGSTGIVTMSKQSGCLAYLSSAQSIPNNAVTKVQLDAVVFDTQGEFDTTTNNRFDVTETGIYTVSGTLYWESAPARLDVYIFIDGSSVKQIEKVEGSDTYTAWQATDSFYVAAGSYIELHAKQQSGVAINLVAGETRMSIVKVA